MLVGDLAIRKEQAHLIDNVVDDDEGVVDEDDPEE